MINDSDMTMKRVFVILAAAVLLAGCSKESKPATETTQAPSSEAGQLSIAYIDVDTLITQYDFCIDYAAVLEQKSLRIQQTLQQKSDQLESDMVAFQKKYQDGSFSSQEEFDNAQVALQKKQVQLQNLQESLVNEFNKEQTMYNDALHDSLANFLADFNATLGYTYILAKQGDNILLADPRHDITRDVIKGLNKRYKPSAELSKEAKKAKAE